MSYKKKCEEKRLNKSSVGLSAGRCHTPALRLVYDNYLAIQKSDQILVYKITGLFTNHVLPFVLQTNFETDVEILKFLNASMDFSHTMTVSSPVLSIRSAPIPFTTDSLLQAATNELKLSPKETMKCAQKLYEKGFITYMRTDCEKYSNGFLESVQQYIRDDILLRQNINPHLNTRLSNQEESAAHEAIRPVFISIITIPNSNSESDLELDKFSKRLYELIWKRTMESCMASAQIHILRAEIVAPQNHTYVFACEQIIFGGWKVIKTDNKKTQKEELNNKIYRYLQQQQKQPSCLIECLNIDCSQHSIKTTSHLSEAHLIQLLKDRGIGRPSTYANIVLKIQENGYVKNQDIEGIKKNTIDYILKTEPTYKHIVSVPRVQFFGNEKNKLVIQPIGIKVIIYCMEHWPVLFDYDFTNKMEKEMDLIATSSIKDNPTNIIRLCTELCTNFKTNVESITNDNTNICIPIMDRNNNKFKLVLTVGKNGPVIINKTNPKKYTFLSVKKELNLNELYIQTKDSKKIVYLENVLSAEHKNETTEKTDILREINAEISIRRSKYERPNYIFYKTPKMHKPRFKSLDTFPHDYMTCEAQLIVDFMK